MLPRPIKTHYFTMVLALLPLAGCGKKSKAQNPDPVAAPGGTTINGLPAAFSTWDLKSDFSTADLKAKDL